jgi:hypothetical protein
MWLLRKARGLAAIMSEDSEKYLKLNIEESPLSLKLNIIEINRIMIKLDYQR